MGDPFTLPSVNTASAKNGSSALNLSCYVAGTKVESDTFLEVRSPYDNRLVGTVKLAAVAHVQQAIEVAMKAGKRTTKYERYSILEKARQLLIERKEEFAKLISAESGLAIREARYETGRAHDVLMFAAIESLKDDGQIFSCDVSPGGKARKIFTTREPLSLAVCITPFNHPLNQVAHKIAPAIAVGTPAILKPSEKTPLTAIKFVELFYDAGLPPYMLSILLGPTKEIPAHGFSIQDIHTYGDRNRSVVVFIHLIGFGDKQSLATNAAAFFAGMQKNKYLDGKKTTITPANLNTNKLDSIIGINGEILENIYQYRFGQASASNGPPTLSHPPGYQSWAAWQGTDDLAVVTGNFTMHALELAPVIKALAENGIELVYNHLVHENPDIFFLHYWGVGNAEQLAKGLRAGLDAQR